MTDPMNVTHVVLSLEVGGLERNVVNQVREGQALGQRVSVVCLERAGELAPRIQALGGEVICLHKRPGIRLSLIGQLRRLFRQSRPDLVHTHQIPTLFYTGPATRCLGNMRVVHTEHGLPLFDNSIRTRWLGRVSAAFCDRFFCLTREMASAVIRFRVACRRKVQLIRNGIETSSFTEPGNPRALRSALGIPDDAKIIGTVGRLVEIKQYDLLIRSFARFKAKCQQSHLLMVGDGPLRPGLKRLAGELGLSECVHFAGYQSQVNEYLHAMDCFVLTSRSEGTPQAVLEASMARLPIVATNVGGVPEVINHNETGILIPSGDEDALLRELQRVTEDKELGVRLGDAAQLRVQSLYGIGRMAMEYHQQYIKLLSCRA